jgi:hypothetical protein
MRNWTAIALVVLLLIIVRPRWCSSTRRRQPVVDRATPRWKRTLRGTPTGAPSGCGAACLDRVADRSVRSNTVIGSSAASAPNVVVSIGSPYSMIHFDGSGSSANGPNTGSASICATTGK